MKLANVRGRLCIVTRSNTGIDVNLASEGRFSFDPQLVFERWDEFVDWAEQKIVSEEFTFANSDLGAPVPAPRQIFAIGLNYRKHAVEAGFAVPESPTVFTKFQSSLTGSTTIVTLPPQGTTDWEVEIVAVVGRTASHVHEAEGWSYVAGLTLGQDLSERSIQTEGPSPQFSLGKSFPGFSPIGPLLVTPDEFGDRDNLHIGCAVNGIEMQTGHTSDLIFSIPALIARLSRVVTLWPGDLIFTGTPSGVGFGRTPSVFLKRGDCLVSWADGIGEMSQTFV